MERIIYSQGRERHSNLMHRFELGKMNKWQLEIVFRQQTQEFLETMHMHLSKDVEEEILNSMKKSRK